MWALLTSDSIIRLPMRIVMFVPASFLAALFGAVVPTLRSSCVLTWAPVVVKPHLRMRSIMACDVAASIRLPSPHAALLTFVSMWSLPSSFCRISQKCCGKLRLQSSIAPSSLKLYVHSNGSCISSPPCCVLCNLSRSCLILCRFCSFCRFLTLLGRSSFIMVFSVFCPSTRAVAFTHCNHEPQYSENF